MKKSKVYFHTSPETFGISVIESIAAGCIPIVPNNSAHVETVPFEELRYPADNIQIARKKIRDALEGKYDDLLEPLQNSLAKYDKEIFKKSFVEFVKNVYQNIWHALEPNGQERSLNAILQLIFDDKK